MQWPDYPHNILAYLNRHPQAQDTIEGITDWWLLEERVRFVSAEVSKALAELTARGFVLAKRRRDGRVVFRINPEKRAEIREWLARCDPAEEPERSPVLRRRRRR